MIRTGKKPGTPRLLIDARTARTGGGATVLRAIDRYLLPSLEGINVDVRRPGDGSGSVASHPALPLTSPGFQPDVVLALSEAANVGLGGSRSTIVMARNWNCWTPQATVRRRVRTRVAQSNARRADVILVATDAFGQAVRSSTTSKASIEVLPFGVGEQFKPEGTRANGKYFLCVGDWYPWKKFELAVEALGLIAEEHPDISLRIAGREIRDDYLTGVLERAQQLGIKGKVEVLGSVDPSRLAELYRGAIATLVTSELETFGHPYVEAMASGTPLIGRATDVSCELVAEAGILLPGSPGPFAEAMRRVIEGDRGALTAAGRARAGRFTWVDYAERLRVLIADELMR